MTISDIPLVEACMSEDLFRSDCSIARTLDILGDKWTLLIVRDLLWHGKLTFQALLESAEQIPTNILSDRLKRLVEWELVQRQAYQQRPPRYEYRLTEKGQALEPVLLNIMSWGHSHLGGGRYDPKSGRSWTAKKGGR